MSNILAPFPTLNEELLERIQVEVDFINVFYHFGDSRKELNIVLNDEDEYYIEDDEDIWNPLDNDINFNIRLRVNNKNVLFDENEGIINKNAILGIAFSWMSKKSNQTKTFPIAEIRLDNENAVVTHIQETIKKAELKRKIDFKIILYVKHISEEYNYYNQAVGTVLGNIWESSINLEGDGSSFPVEVIQDKNQLLWKAKFNFNDIFEDEFNKDNICLQLNKSHKDFPSLNIDSEECSPLMKEIISEFIYLLMCELKELEIDLNIFNEYQVDPESSNIANVVKMWISLFKIDFSTNYNMIQSIKKGINNVI